LKVDEIQVNLQNLEGEKNISNVGTLKVGKKWFGKKTPKHSTYNIQLNRMSWFFDLPSAITLNILY
jgi:hypothetical protein